MDDAIFDAMAKGVAERGATRRAALALLAGTVLGGLGGFGPPSMDAAASSVSGGRNRRRKKKRCRGGKTRCDGACVDLRSDKDHCGSCATGCPADRICQERRCVCDPAAADCACDTFADCPQGKVCCDLGVNNRCLTGLRGACQADAECCFSICQGGRCCLANGEPCNEAASSVCCSGVCANGRCGPDCIAPLVACGAVCCLASHCVDGRCDLGG